LNKLNLRNAANRKVRSQKGRALTHSSIWRRRIGQAFNISKTIYFFIGVAAGFAVNALSIPKSVVEFSRYFADAKAYVDTNLYRPEYWTGIFDAYPEGFVDMGDMGISSPSGAALELAVVNGQHLDGRIWWDGSCKLGSPYQGLLIEGSVHLGGHMADVRVFDFLGGHRVDFIEGRLQNDGLMIEFAGFPEGSRLNGNRIAKNPEPATIERWSDLYCDWLTNGRQSELTD
jgi:hypothetical protein